MSDTPNVKQKPHDVVYAVHLVIRRDGEGSMEVINDGNSMSCDIQRLPRATATAVTNMILGLVDDEPPGTGGAG